MMEPTIAKASGGETEPLWRRFRPHNIRFTLYFTYFELKKQYADSALGVMWMVVEPLLRMGLYVLVFAVLLGRRFQLVEGGNAARFDYTLYILSGLVPWHFVSFSFSRGMGMITSYAGFIRQPNFPYRTLPSVMFLLSMPGHLTSMAVLLVLFVVAGRLGEVQWHLLALAYLLIFYFMRGLITVLGAATARIMDLRNAVPLLLQVLIYTSPIIYKPEMIPEKLRFIMYSNPLSYLVGAFKYALSGDDTLSIITPILDFVILAVMAAVLVTVQQAVLTRIRSTGIDHVA